MTPREMVKAAIRHEEIDRIPYCVKLTWEAEQKIRDEQGIESPSEWLDNDVFILDPPWWQWHELGPEWEAMIPPDARPTLRGTGSYPDFEEKVKRCADEKQKYVLVTIYASHFEKAYFARNIENFLADMAGDIEFARKLCNLIIEKNLVMLENFLDMPEVDGVLLGSDWGSQRGLLMSPKVWDDLIRPGEQREYDLIHDYGKDVWVHSCGSIEPLLPRLVEMGLDVLNPVQPECMDIAQLKADFGQDLTFWGGISTQQTLPFGSPEDVRKECHRVRELMSADGGYIYSPSQAIQGDVPFENLATLLEVARMPRS